MKTIITKVLFAVMLMTTPSCMLFRDDKPKRDFPSFYSSEAHGALNHAKSIINDVGVHKVKDKDVKLSLIPGQKKFSDAWCWQIFYSHLNRTIWVRGLCHGRIVEVGKHP